MKKLYVVNNWNSDEECFNFMDFVCAKDEEDALKVAEKEFLDEILEVYEVKVKGYKIIVEGVEK